MVRKRRSGSADIFSAALKYFTLRGYLTLLWKLDHVPKLTLIRGTVPSSLKS